MVLCFARVIIAPRIHYLVHCWWYNCIKKNDFDHFWSFLYHFCINCYQFLSVFISFYQFLSFFDKLDKLTNWLTDWLTECKWLKCYLKSVFITVIELWDFYLLLTIKICFTVYYAGAIYFFMLELKLSPKLSLNCSHYTMHFGLLELNNDLLELFIWYYALQEL